MGTLAELLDLQSGVISRRQVLDCGLNDADIERKVRRREWARVHEGVYVDHTGQLTWVQRAWAAVLFSWPAALTHGSALRAAEGPGREKADDERIHVVVERSRSLVAPPGVRIHRGGALDSRVQWNTSPPRVRYEEAALDVAAEAPDDFAAIAVLARGVQARRTTAERMVRSLEGRKRLKRRTWMAQVLRDVAEGSCSALEVGYARRVERPHGLPRGSRQEVGQGRVGRTYRDLAFAQPLDLELDGRLFHDSAEGRDRDFDRDLLALVGGRLTARLSWGQVFGRPCWTAGQVGRLLAELGWTGTTGRCGPDCSLGG